MDRHHILIVEDNEALGSVVKLNFEAAGYRVTLARDATAAQAAVSAELPRVIVLDILLPDMNGLDLLRTLRTSGVTVPIIVTSGLDTEEDRVCGLQRGADDYIVKPYSIAELILRVNNWIRRTEAPAPASTTVPLIEIDVRAGRIRLRGEVVALSPKEFLLLVGVASERGAIVTKAHLRKTIWNIGPNIHSDTLECHLKQLRAKLGLHQLVGSIQTVRRKGLRWTLGEADVIWI